MSKVRLLHQSRPVLYDSGVVSRVLDDVLNPVLLDFATTHAAIVGTRAVFVSQTTLFELQPVVRVLKQRFLRQQRLVSEFVEDFDYLPLSEEIGQVTISLKRGIEQLKFADATIAATAIVYGLDLFTLNEADFVIIPGLRLYKPANYSELLARLGMAKGVKLQAALDRAGCGGRGRRGAGRNPGSGGRRGMLG